MNRVFVVTSGDVHDYSSSDLEGAFSSLELSEEYITRCKERDDPEYPKWYFIEECAVDEMLEITE